MTKITVSPELSEEDFQTALRRAGFLDQGSSFGTRRFAVMLPTQGAFIGQIPGVYAGRFGSFQPSLTLDHLNNVAALASLAAKKNSAPRSKKPRVSAPASSEQLNLEHAPSA